MKTCSTCKFMAERRAREELHTCVRIIHGNKDSWEGPLYEDRRAVVVDGSGYSARLLVLPTFGCVLHEEKNSDV